MIKVIGWAGIFWLGVVLPVSAPGQVAPHEEYFPLEKGAEWVYRCSGVCEGEVELQIRVTGAQEIGGKPYLIMESSAGRKLLLRMEGTGLREYDSGPGREAPMAAIGTPPPAIFGDLPANCKPAARVFGAQQHEGEAGGPGMTMVAEYLGPNCEETGLVREVYSPGFGLVRRIERANGGERTWELVRRQPGGRDDTTHQQLKISLELDRDIYYMGAEMEPSPNQETPIPELRATIRVTNTSAAGVTVRFATGQRYDLTLRNASGEMFYQWTRGQFFTQALSEEMFPPGDTSYTIAVPLANAEGQRLPPGVYEAVGRLTPMDNGPHLEARQKFHVRYGVRPE